MNQFLCLGKKWSKKEVKKLGGAHFNLYPLDPCEEWRDGSRLLALTNAVVLHGDDGEDCSGDESVAGLGGYGG